MAGRDAGQKCVIVELMEGKYVLIDGMTRRRKCNTLHLEPTSETLDIKKGATHEEIVEAFKNIDHHIKQKKTKPKTEKPKKVYKQSSDKEDKHTKATTKATAKETTKKEKHINKK
jgi:large subunit ribosomal protein L14e